MPDLFFNFNLIVKHGVFNFFYNYYYHRLILTQLKIVAWYFTLGAQIFLVNAAL
jgi:hypothetical protein